MVLKKGTMVSPWMECIPRGTRYTPRDDFHVRR